MNLQRWRELAIVDGVESAFEGLVSDNDSRGRPGLSEYTSIVGW